MVKKKPRPKVTVHLSSELKKELETEALAQGQSVSNYVMQLVMAKLRKKQESGAVY